MDSMNALTPANAPDEHRMDARTAALLRLLLIAAEDLRYAHREGTLGDFRQDFLVENSPAIAEQAGIPRVALVLPAPEFAELRQTDDSPRLQQAPVLAPATAWELAEMLRRIVADCKGVRGLHSPAAPRPVLLNEAVALLGRVATADTDRKERDS